MVAPISALLMAGLGHALAQTRAPDIYTCIDRQGRPRTADRPIPECADREQQLRSPNGTVRATLSPPQSAQERERQEALERQATQARENQLEERRRERALLLRYPNQPAHDKERAEALAQLALVRQTGVNRLTELVRQGERLQTEMEFYRKDPARAPLALRRQIDENDRSQVVQQRFVAEQDAERERVNARFDAELARLRPLWAASASAPAPAASQAR
jgi:hypothetical protein